LHLSFTAISEPVNNKTVIAASGTLFISVWHEKYTQVKWHGLAAFFADHALHIEPLIAQRNISGGRL
jgi:hypothetical protein